jgi:hypothetical protein
VTLVSPRFGNEEGVHLGFSRELLIYGLIQLIHLRKYNEALIHLVFSILSFGYYWHWIAKNFRNNYVSSLLIQGYEPKSDFDMKLLMYNGIIKNNTSTSYIQISRLGSVDHKI